MFRKINTSIMMWIRPEGIRRKSWRVLISLEMLERQSASEKTSHD
jgi:hypothetical protein